MDEVYALVSELKQLSMAFFCIFVIRNANVHFFIRLKHQFCRMHLSSCMSSQADGCQHRMTHNFQPVISKEPSDIGDKASENVDGEKANMDLPELTVHQSGSDIFSTIQWNSHFCYLKFISFSTVPNYLQESF